MGVCPRGTRAFKGRVNTKTTYRKDGINMKVKSMLKISSATEIEILVPKTDENGKELFYSWNIDYLRKEENYFGRLHACIDCSYYLPKEVKQLEVESFTACNNKLLIFTKGDK